MKKHLTTLVLGVTLMAMCVAWPFSIRAESNKFGIHIAVPSDEDITRATQLVNSNGGEYGYVTFVIQENNRDVHYWQQIFEKLRKAKLIPIIRLATQPEGGYWKTPKAEDAEEWASFLNKLNWVTKERYIIVFNEPNHAAEWGGKTDAKEYGRVAANFARFLKSESKDFFVMLAGLDLAAPESPPLYGDAYRYLQTGLTEFCAVLKAQGLSCADYIDGISSHSYPNPGFVGSPYDTGRTSIRGYQFEIGWYKDILGEELPVFITETGWDAFRLGQDTVASYFTTALNEVWLPDERIRAITPFLLNYQGEPFLQFSFLTQHSAESYPKYTAIQSLSKPKGTPNIIDTVRIATELPRKVVEDSEYDIPVTIENTGQAIWGSEHKLYITTLENPSFQVAADPVTVPELKPFQKATIPVHMMTRKGLPMKSGMVAVTMKRGDMAIGSTLPKRMDMELRPNLKLKISLFSKGLSTGNDFEVQIFDQTEQLVYNKAPLNVTLGRATVDRVPNIIPGKQYRIVILKPYYLPRQIVHVLAVGENEIEFEQLLPFDYDKDGKISVGDVQGLFFRRGQTDKNFFQKMKLLIP